VYLNDAHLSRLHGFARLLSLLDPLVTGVMGVVAIGLGMTNVEGGYPATVTPTNNDVDPTKDNERTPTDDEKAELDSNTPARAVLFPEDPAPEPNEPG
jgi:hypothetical protein